MIDSDLETPSGVLYITGFSDVLKINYIVIIITLECCDS